jgi:iron complex outermembrane receptor protein
VPPAFRVVGPDGALSDPLVRPEQVRDWEAGLRARGPWGEATLGGYWMSFSNEIVYNGQIDDNGNPITGNAARSRHAGIEASLRGQAGAHLAWSGTMGWNHDRFGRYLEYVDSTTTVDYSGNRIAGFPDLIARVTATVRFGDGRLELGADHVGRQYLDNTENDRKDRAAGLPGPFEDKSIAPWTVANAALGWQFPAALGGREWSVELRVNNLFDTRYETAGYVDYPAPAYAPTPVWIPAATRNFFLGVKAAL